MGPARPLSPGEHVGGGCVGLRPAGGGLALISRGSGEEGSLTVLGVLVRKLQWDERAVAYGDFRNALLFRSLLVGLMGSLKAHYWKWEL